MFTINSIVPEMGAYVKKKNLNIYGISEIIDGEEFSESIVPAPWCTDVYSVSKFVSSAAVGVLWDEGKIDLHAPIIKLIKDCPKPAEPKWKSVTLHDCLRHRTGLLDGNLDIDNENDEGIDNWLSSILALPIEGERDVNYHYTDAAFYLVCRAVQSVTGENVHAYLQRKLFHELGFRESSWSVCPWGFTTGGSGFCANDRDITRLGYLWANEGKYNGKQLISSEYVHLSLKNGYGIAQRDDYPDYYFKTGAHGQIVVMLPDEHRALTIRGYYSSDDRTELVDTFFPPCNLE